MTTLGNSLIACTVISLLALPSFAQQGPQGNGDGRCGNVPEDCDSSGPHASDRGQGRGRGGWHRAQLGCQAQQVLDGGAITEAETVHVLMMRQEEKLARDVYSTLNKRWPTNVFKNITASEQRHMDAIGRIIVAQELDDPAADNTVGVYTDPAFDELYKSLTEKGGVSYVDALQVGAYIEELDILDLGDALEDVENLSVTRVFENLLWGSHNHLRAFVGQLAGEGVIYTPQLMTQDLYEAIISGSVERGAGSNNSQGTQKNN